MSEAFSLDGDAPIELLEERVKTIQLMIDMYTAELNRWHGIKNKLDGMINAKLLESTEIVEEPTDLGAKATRPKIAGARKRPVANQKGATLSFLPTVTAPSVQELQQLEKERVPAELSAASDKIGTDAKPSAVGAAIKKGVPMMGFNPMAGLKKEAGPMLKMENCKDCGCEEFQADAFKKTKCTNCFHVHPVSAEIGQEKVTENSVPKGNKEKKKLADNHKAEEKVHVFPVQEPLSENEEKCLELEDSALPKLPEVLPDGPVLPELPSIPKLPELPESTEDGPLISTPPIPDAGPEKDDMPPMLPKVPSTLLIEEVTELPKTSVLNQKGSLPKPNATQYSEVVPPCRSCGCDKFQQDRFKPSKCSTCFHVHVPPKAPEVKPDN